MPIDKYADDEREERESGVSEAIKTQFFEFDCPTCSANNPCDPPIRNGDEPICYYCGSQFQVRIGDTGKLRLREL